MLNPALRADALHSPRVSLIASTLCFIVILLDGYDTGVISYTAPMLAHDWNLASAAFTPAFVATSLGAVVGYVSCGALAARFGHRLLVTASVAFFGLMSLATLWATDMTSLTVLRFVTALGLGGAIPTAIALASAHAAANRRERTATIVTVAILVGGTIGGYISVPILQRWGWPGPYVLGGVVPLLLVPTLVAWLPDAPVRDIKQQPKSVRGQYMSTLQSRGEIDEGTAGNTAVRGHGQDREQGELRGKGVRYRSPAQRSRLPVPRKCPCHPD
jgi:AAHS family 4-hydroxybenzoate transporter-like MFS transporter